jgi:hypothetical protein
LLPEVEDELLFPVEDASVLLPEAGDDEDPVEPDCEFNELLPEDPPALVPPGVYALPPVPNPAWTP